MKTHEIGYSVGCAGTVTVEAASEEEARELFYKLYGPVELAERADDYDWHGDLNITEEGK